MVQGPIAAIRGHPDAGTQWVREAPNDMIKTLSIVLMAGALSACGSTEVVAPTMNVSVGQQLIDLKNARDSNAISQKEWEQQKERLINSVR